MLLAWSENELSATKTKATMPISETSYQRSSHKATSNGAVRQAPDSRQDLAQIGGQFSETPQQTSVSSIVVLTKDGERLSRNEEPRNGRYISATMTMKLEN